MARFTPVPTEASDAVEVEHYGAVLDLYKRAHESWWRPFPYTERKLSERWRLSRRQTRTVLGRLNACGLITITKGKGYEPSTIKVFDPTEKEADQMVDQSRTKVGPRSDQKVDQGNRHSTPDIDEGGPDGGPRSDQDRTKVGPDGGPPIRDETRDHRPRDHETTRSEAVVSAPPDVPAEAYDLFSAPETPAAAVATVPKNSAAKRRAANRKAARRIYAHWHSYHPALSAVPDDSSHNKIVAAVERRARALKDGAERRRYEPTDWTIAEQDLVDLVDWFHTAPGAGHWQGKNDRNKTFLGITPIFKKDKHTDRLNDMIEWRGGGRMTRAYSGKYGDTAPPPPEPRKPVLPPELADELRELRKVLDKRPHGLEFPVHVAKTRRRKALEAQGTLR